MDSDHRSTGHCFIFLLIEVCVTITQSLKPEAAFNSKVLLFLTNCWTLVFIFLIPSGINKVFLNRIRLNWIKGENKKLQLGQKIFRCIVSSVIHILSYENVLNVQTPAFILRHWKYFATVTSVFRCHPESSSKTPKHTPTKDRCSQTSEKRKQIPFWCQ